MIRKRDPGHYGSFHLLRNSGPESLADAIIGPVIVSTLLFVAVLANFVIRGMYYPCHLIPR